MERGSAPFRFQFTQGSVVPVDPFHPLVLFLCMQAERRDGTRLETSQIDRFVCLDTITIGAVLNPAQRRTNLLQQLALTIAGTQVDRGIAFNLRAVHLVRLVQIFL